MFVIIEGLLDIYVFNEDENEEVKRGHITAGQFFGEMALLTGKPRSATVIAATDVLGYEISQSCMWDLIMDYPDILENISRVVAERQIQEQHFLENIQREDLIETTQKLTDEILTSIRSFFGMMKETVTYRREH